MPKPDAALLDTSRYPFHVRTEPRFGDLDVNLHINNVAMAALIEDARIRFYHASGHYRNSVGLRTMVASLGIEYLAEGAYPDPIDVHLAIETVGRTSHTVVQLAMQGQRVLAFARTVVVVVGAEGPVSLPAEYVASCNPWRLRG